MTQNQIDILTELQEKLPFISNHVKNTINEIYRNQMEMLNDEKHHRQWQKFIQLFNELLKSLKTDLFDVKESIHDLQIQTLFDQTKLELEKFENTFLTKQLNIEGPYTKSSVVPFDTIFFSVQCEQAKRLWTIV